MKSKFEETTKLKEKLAKAEKDIEELSSEVTRLEREIAKADTRTVLSQNKNLIIKVQNEIEQLKREIHQVLFPKDLISDAPVLNAPLEPEAPARIPRTPSAPESKETTVQAAAPNIKKMDFDEEKLKQQDKERATREIEAEMAVAANIAAASAACQRAQMAAAANDSDSDWVDESEATKTTMQTVQRPQPPLQIDKEKEKEKSIEKRTMEIRIARLNEQRIVNEIARLESMILEKKTKIESLREKIEGLISDLAIKTGIKDLYVEAIKSQSELISNLNKTKGLLIAKKNTIVKRIDGALETESPTIASEETTSAEKPVTSKQQPDASDGRSALLLAIQLAAQKKATTPSPANLSAKPVKPVLATSNKSHTPLPIDQVVANGMLARRNVIETEDDDETEEEEANTVQDKLKDLGIIPKAVDPQKMEVARTEALQITTAAVTAVEQARSATSIDVFLAETDTQIDSVLANIRKNAAEEREAVALKPVAKESEHAAENTAQPEKANNPKEGDTVVIAAKTELAPEVAHSNVKRAAEEIHQLLDDRRKKEVRRINKKQKELFMAKMNEARVKAHEEKPGEQPEPNSQNQDQKLAERNRAGVEVVEVKPFEQIQPKLQTVVEADAPLKNNAQQDNIQSIRQKLLDKAMFDHRLLRLEIEAITFELKANQAYAAGDEKAELEYAEACGHARILHEMLRSYKDDFLEGKGDLSTDVAAFTKNCEQSLDSKEARSLEVHIGIGSTIKNFIYSIAKALREVFSSYNPEAKTIPHEEAVICSTDSMEKIIAMKNSLIDLKNSYLSKDSQLDKNETRKP